jgi:predicted NBD/HSP70 family sugar kinase
MRRKEQGSPYSVAIGNNPERTRSHNRRVVIEAIRQHGPLGRAEVARLTRLTAQAVSNIVAELVEDGLLVERGRRRTARGQPPVELVINPEGGVTAGIEVAADHLVTVLVDLSGRARASRMVSVDGADPGSVIPLLKDELARTRSAVRKAPRRLLGVGVAMPGPFEVEGMSSVGPTTLPGWRGVDAESLIASAIGERVTVGNDATAAAVGERLHGVAQHLRHFCFLYFGAGVGLGIVVDGQPFRGAFGNAGEIGHVPVIAEGLPCPCGRRGCLERYASPHALFERLRCAGLPAHGPEDLRRLHDRQDPILKAWVADSARLLAPVVAILENLFDPESIVFGGALPDVIMNDLIAALEPLPLSVASRSPRTVPRVQRGATGHLTAALGAAALPLLEAVTPALGRALSSGMRDGPRDADRPTSGDSAHAHEP